MRLGGIEFKFGIEVYGWQVVAGVGASFFVGESFRAVSVGHPKEPGLSYVFTHDVYRRPGGNFCNLGFSRIEAFGRQIVAGTGASSSAGQRFRPAGVVNPRESGLD